MTTSLPGTIADIEIPDTALVRATTEFIRDAEDDLLFDHSRRVYLFGALQGRRRGLNPDLELLYVGAMFHDLGLTDPTAAPRRCGSRSTAPTRPTTSCSITASPQPMPARSGSALPCTPPPGFPSSSTPRPRWSPPGSKPTSWASAATTCQRCTGRGHRRPSTSRLQAAHPQCLQRRRQAAPDTAFGTVNADVLAHFDDTYTRDDFVNIILTNTWPE